MNDETTFKVGDLVMFKNRTQITTGGMPVQEVNTNLFDTLLMVNSQWWRPSAFISLDEWKANYFHRSIKRDEK